ncbi:MAG: diguanylate cyclase, partial [Gallionellaceae bacterium]
VSQYGKLGSHYALARNTLSSLDLDDVETALTKQLLVETEMAQKLQNQVLDQLSLNHFQQAQEVLNRQAMPAQNNIVVSINDLLDYEFKRSHEAAEKLHKQNSQTQFLMLAGGVASALFVGLIASFVNRRMGRLIKDIEASAYQIQEANHSLESLRLALDHHDIVSIADVQGRITFVNDLFCQISGYAREALIGQNHRIINSGTHPKIFFDDMWLTISSGKIWQGEICNRSKNGKLYWVYSTILPFLDDAGLPYQYISVRTDFTAIKQAELVLKRGKQELEKLVQERTEALMEREEVLHSITQAAQDAVIMINSCGNISHWNPAAEKMFGYAAAEAIGLNLHNLVAPARYREAHNSGFASFIQSGKGVLIGEVTELEAQRRDGSEFPIEISISSVKIKDQWHAVAIVRDITVRKLADEHLKELASTDVLTGALNRRRFNEVLNNELERAKRYGSTFILIIFDIDHFKRINDTFGHQAGDQVLIKLALLVAKSIRATDLFARWGGEEFTVLAAHYDTDSPVSLAEKLRMLIAEFDFAEVGTVTCSFGTTEYVVGDTEASILKRADKNLYKAKNSGRNCVVTD